MLKSVSALKPLLGRETTINLTFCSQQRPKPLWQFWRNLPFWILLVSSGAGCFVVGANSASANSGSCEDRNQLIWPTLLGVEQTGDVSCTATTQYLFSRTLTLAINANLPASLKPNSPENLSPTLSELQLSPHITSGSTPNSFVKMPKLGNQAAASNLAVGQIDFNRSQAGDPRGGGAGGKEKIDFGTHENLLGKLLGLEPQLMPSQVDDDYWERLPQVIPGAVDGRAVDLGMSSVGLSQQGNRVVVETVPSAEPEVPPNSSQAQKPSSEQEVPATEIDPELGRLRLRLQKVPPARPEPYFYVVPRLNYYYGSNMFSSVDPIDDAMIVPSLMLWSTPKLSSRTYLSFLIDSNLIRYIKESQYDYNLFRFQVGIRQQLNPRMFGEFGWSHQLFYRAEGGDRFLKENYIYLWLSRRDWLNRRLALDSFSDFRFGFADPAERTRFTNFSSVSLNYYFQPNLQAGVDYQLSFSDYTNIGRQDYYQRFTGHLGYYITPTSQIYLQGGLSLGDSSARNINYDGLFFTLTYSINLPVVPR